MLYCCQTDITCSTIMSRNNDKNNNVFYIVDFQGRTGTLKVEEVQ